MEKLKLFDYLGSLNHTKEHLLDGAPDDVIKGYPPFVVNLGMSLRMDTIMYANDMNMHIGLPPKMNYDYYFYGLDKAKRFAKWPKKQKSEDIQLISQFYNVSMEKAAQYRTLLTDKDVETIKNKLYQGGKQ